jgi:hypothetical protein
MNKRSKPFHQKKQYNHDVGLSAKWNEIKLNNYYDYNYYWDTLHFFIHHLKHNRNCHKFKFNNVINHLQSRLGSCILFHFLQCWLLYFATTRTLAKKCSNAIMCFKARHTYFFVISRATIYNRLNTCWKRLANCFAITSTRVNGIITWRCRACSSCFWIEFNKN